VGAALWALSFVKTPASQTPEVVAESSYAEHAQYYDIDIPYPATSAQKRAVIEAGLKPSIDEFKSAVAELDASVMPSLAEHKLALSAEYKEYQAPGYDSFLFTIYEDTGGAHPNGFFKTFVFDEHDAPVTIENLSSNPQALQILSREAKAQVTAEVKKRLGQEDVADIIFAEGLEARAENFSNFIIDGSDIVVEIPPYQVAAYALGSFEVRVPLSSIK